MEFPRLAAVGVPGTLCDARIFAPLSAHLDRAIAGAVGIDQPTVEIAAGALLRAAPERFIAVGFSLGGFVVLELMRHHADRLAGAVLLATNALALQGTADAKHEDLALFEDRGAAAVIARHWGNYVAPANAARDDMRATVEAMAMATPLGAFAAQTALAISRPDSRATLATTPIPTLLIDGTLDRTSPPERNRALRLSPAVRRMEIAESGHLVPLEAPVAAANVINAFALECDACCSA